MTVSGRIAAAPVVARPPGLLAVSLYMSRVALMPRAQGIVKRRTLAAPAVAGPVQHPEASSFVDIPSGRGIAMLKVPDTFREVTD
jgi:hypothetical protein